MSGPSAYSFPHPPRSAPHGPHASFPECLTQTRPVAHAAVDFDEVRGGEGEAAYVPNRGSAGAAYDMLLGRIARPPTPPAGAQGSCSGGADDGDATRFTVRTDVTTPFLTPVQVPRSAGGAMRRRSASSSASSSGQRGAGGPLVVLASLSAPSIALETPAGRVVTVPLLDGASVPPNASHYYVPSNAVVSAHTVLRLADDGGEPLTLHALRIRRPSMPAKDLYPLLYKHSMREDSSVDLQLWGINYLGSALPARPYVVTPPARGQLWLHGRVNDPSALLDVPGEPAFDSDVGGYSLVTYVPAPDGSGDNHDAVVYRLQLEPSAVQSTLLHDATLANITSEAAHVGMSVIEIDDLPTGRSSHHLVEEDAPPLRVNLSVYDAEVGAPLDGAP